MRGRTHTHGARGVLVDTAAVDADRFPPIPILPDISELPWGGGALKPLLLGADSMMCQISQPC